MARRFFFVFLRLEFVLLLLTLGGEKNVPRTAVLADDLFIRTDERRDDLDRRRDYQPTVVAVEVDTARRSVGSISQPLGSPWCQGMPAFWLVGHQPGETESPWCLVTTVTGGASHHSDNQLPSFVHYNYTNSQWVKSRTTVLDRQDVVNSKDEKPQLSLDRHDCTTVDVNADGLLDIICGVGANNGNGRGYNEVYVTQPTDGRVVKALYGHGLNKWPTMRNRLITHLRAANDGAQMILMAVKGTQRADGASNIHRMYKLVPSTEAQHGFYFQHVPGPWNRYTSATCLRTVDVNKDGYDDILMCQKNRMGRIFTQHANGTFTQVRYAAVMAHNWRNARVADVTGDGVVDLVVVGRATSRSYVRVFEGRPAPPYFDFSRKGVWYQRRLPYATPDVEVLDVNQDGIADIYVIQTEEHTNGTYCGRLFDKKKWWKSTIPQPPADFVPPPDEAHDLLLVGTGASSEIEDQRPKLFTEVVMEHAVGGCGAYMAWFGNSYTMILSHGSFSRPGYSVLLQW